MAGRCQLLLAHFYHIRIQSVFASRNFRAASCNPQREEELNRYLLTFSLYNKKHKKSLTHKTTNSQMWIETLIQLKETPSEMLKLYIDFPPVFRLDDSG